MSNIQAITADRHGDRNWYRNKNYLFAAQDALCILVAGELPNAILSLPVAFTKIDEQYMPVVVLGLKQGQNSLVDTNGSWSNSYLPNYYRCFPFSVGEQDDECFLCVDEDVALVELDAGIESEPFFDSEGDATDTIKGFLNFLTANVEHRKQTAVICDSLAVLELFEPWPISYKDGDKEKQVAGLFRIKEASLNELSAESFAMLRDNGGLILSYCQLLSMPHISSLIRRVQNQEPVNIGELNFEGLADGGTINFDNL